MKKVLKSRIFAFILGAILFSGLTVVAGTVLSRNVEYDNSKSGSSKTTVQDAIDDLYLKAQSAGGNASIKGLLAAANVNKNYTTIDEVLADTETLSKVISTNASCNYISHTTDWVKKIASNENAMRYIGNDEYCGDKLLDNDIYLDAILNSTYWERVLNVKVPTMTSNTTPSGHAYGYYQNQSIVYRAFDGNVNTYGKDELSGQSTTEPDGVIIYDFEKPIKVKRFSVRPYYGSNQVQYLGNYQIRATNDNTLNISDWDTIATGVIPYLQQASTRTIDITGSHTKYRYWALVGMNEFQSASESTTSGGMIISELQFYGH